MGNQRVLARDLTVAKASRERIRSRCRSRCRTCCPCPSPTPCSTSTRTARAMGENGPVVNGLLIAAVKDAVLGNVRATQLAGPQPHGRRPHPVRQRAPPGQPPRPRRHRRPRRDRPQHHLRRHRDRRRPAVRPHHPLRRRRRHAGDRGQARVIAAEAAVAVKSARGLARAHDNAEEQASSAAIFESVNELLGSLRNTDPVLRQHASDRDGLAASCSPAAAPLLPGLPDALSEVTRLPVVAADPVRHRRHLASPSTRRPSAAAPPTSPWPSGSHSGAPHENLRRRLRHHGRRRTAPRRPAAPRGPGRASRRRRVPPRLDRRRRLVAAAVVASGAATLHAVDGRARPAAAQSRHRTAADRAGQYTEVRGPQAEIQLLSAAQKVGGATEIDWPAYLAQIQSTLPLGVTDRRRHDRPGLAASPLPAAATPLLGARVGTVTFTASSPSLPSFPDWLDGLATLPGLRRRPPGSVTLGRRRLRRLRDHAHQPEALLEPLRTTKGE